MLKQRIIRIKVVCSIYSQSYYILLTERGGLMKLVTVLENKSFNKKLTYKHGLSIYIEFKHKKILFDIGPNNDYLKNAKNLNIDIRDVDYLVISHGHYDHGKKLSYFLEYNKKAQVFISPNAFDKHYARIFKIPINIGLKKPKDTSRITFVDGNLELFSGAVISSKVPFKKSILSDQRLYVNKNKKYLQDSFDHELYFILQEDEKNVLISGCSHKGIENIITSLQQELNIQFTHIVGGFHLMRYRNSNPSQKEYIQQLGLRFNQTNKMYYTCHCTGDQAYRELDQVMDKLKPLHTGDIINI